MPSSPSFCGDECGSSSKEGRRAALCASTLRFLLGGVDGGVEGGGMLLSMGDSIGGCPLDIVDDDRGAWRNFRESLDARDESSGITCR
jgi:hypothetical protein